MPDPLRVIVDQTSVHTNMADNKALDGLQKRATMPMSAFHPAKATTTMSTDSPGTTSSALSPSSNTSPTDSNGHHADPTVPATSSHQAELESLGGTELLRAKPRRAFRPTDDKWNSNIIYNLAAPTKTRKPMLPNAWAHAKAQADRKREYLEILDDINENRITYEDIESQMTSTEEHYARILLEGVSVKRENRMVKQKVPSPELSVGCMTFHARSQLIQVAERIHEACGVEVLIMMTKGNNEDIFAPVLWGTPKAMDFWCGVLKIDMMENIRLVEGYCVNTLKAVEGRAGDLRPGVLTVTWRSEERTGSGYNGGSLREPPNSWLAATWRSKERTGSGYNGDSLREPSNSWLAVTWHSCERTGSVGGWHSLRE
ncbi:uncharacterized protein EI90DRAFT_3134167 [Cantharellus anzutake]|uniref:uncharacterized protein n=1 Tax=Cantharellus anzutake TaxID=1750568 RepID=UPI0019086925|nr:uncharacterized protein EI90DRAFT_3134167 [Cantharellus anzutake]KAF8316929.1 hypothetical protein EI90DRAFT_3134167 [Cantharellus anzutake]